MKRPKQLYVEPFAYRVQYEPEWSIKTGNMGNCVTDTQTIYVDASLTEQAERDTVLHEVLHALWSQTGLQKAYTEDQQEDVVWQLTPRLLAVLKDNPDFVTWLLGR